MKKGLHDSAGYVPDHCDQQNTLATVSVRQCSDLRWYYELQRSCMICHEPRAEPCVEHSHTRIQIPLFRLVHTSMFRMMTCAMNERTQQDYIPFFRMLVGSLIQESPDIRYELQCLREKPWRVSTLSLNSDFRELQITARFRSILRISPQCTIQSIEERAVEGSWKLDVLVKDLKSLHPETWKDAPKRSNTRDRKTVVSTLPIIWKVRPRNNLRVHFTAVLVSGSRQCHSPSLRRLKNTG